MPDQWRLHRLVGQAAVLTLAHARAPDHVGRGRPRGIGGAGSLAAAAVIALRVVACEGGDGGVARRRLLLLVVVVLQMQMQSLQF